MTTPRGQRRTLVTLQNPGPAVPNDDGGTTPSWIALDPPTAYARIVLATGNDRERVAAGTVLTTLSRLVTLAYHPGVTTQTQLAWTDAAGVAHVANVTSTQPDERGIDLQLVCVEVVP